MADLGAGRTRQEVLTSPTPFPKLDPLELGWEEEGRQTAPAWLPGEAAVLCWSPAPPQQRSVEPLAGRCPHLPAEPQPWASLHPPLITTPLAFATEVQASQARSITLCGAHRQGQAPAPGFPWHSEGVVFAPHPPAACGSQALFSVVQQHQTLSWVSFPRSRL